MKTLIKFSVITVLVVIILWQVLSIAQSPPFNFDYPVKCVEYIESVLDRSERITAVIDKQKPLDPAWNYTEAKLALLVEDKDEANSILGSMIKEYDEQSNAPDLRQKALEEIAVLTYFTEDYEQAKIKAEQALKEYPKNLPASTVIAMYYHKKAVQLLKERQYDLAIAEYEKTLAYPIAAELAALAYYFIGHTYEEKGDKQAGLPYYNYIIDNYPELGWAKNARERIEAKE
ncbi:MAG: tetratricopeptide repeat protein [Candidatus Omnitrophota bacterium]